VTADYVRGLEVVLASGEVIRTGRRTIKGVAGFDLTGLFVGSEGTLGVVTEVTARLVPAPAPPQTMVATFSSMERAVQGVLALRAEPHLPSTLELMDRALLEVLQSYADFGYPDDCAALLLIQSDRQGGSSEDVRRFAALLAEAGADEIVVADSRQEADALMEGRRAGQVAVTARGPHLMEDMCVPVPRLGDMIKAGYAVADRLGLEVTMSGHAGDGNLHPTVFIPEGPDGPGRAREAVGELMAAALALGGTITGEHGVGTFKRDWLPTELGQSEMDRQRQLRSFFDPHGILNPGRVH
jgi:glycolate oxidase